MSAVQDQIDKIEAEMARTVSPVSSYYWFTYVVTYLYILNTQQKNKATNYHLGTLKAKLAKLRSELINGPGGKSAGKY